VKYSLIWAATERRAIDCVIKELIVPFSFTKGDLLGERFDVLRPLLRVSFSQTGYFVVIIRALRSFNSTLGRVVQSPIKLTQD